MIARIMLLVVWIWATGCAKNAPLVSYQPGAEYAYEDDVYDVGGAEAGSLETVELEAVSRSRSAKKARVSPPPARQPAPTTTITPSEGEPGPEAQTEPAERMVHYDGYARMRVTKPEDTLDAIEGLALEAGGRVDRRGGTQISVRVPVDQFREIWKAVLKLGDVLDKNVRADDITEQYLAVDLRVRTLRTMRDRLVRLLARAKTEQEKLALLEQITRVTEELDATEANLRTLADLAAMSKISVDTVPRDAFARSTGGLVLSGFDWIRQLSPFNHGVYRSRKRLKLQTPFEMTALRKRGPYVARGAEGTMLWTQRIRNNPRGDGAFWVDAIEERLGREFMNGYRREVGDWSCLWLDEPGADEPYRWQVCVQPDGRFLKVAQAYFPSPVSVARFSRRVDEALGGGGIMIAIAWMWAAFAWAQETAEGPATKVSATMVVAVSQPEDAADTLVAKAEEVGGWFQGRTTRSVSLRVPVDDVDGVLETAIAQGKVIDRSLTRQDVGQSIALTQGRLDAREDVLDDYYKVLKKASADSIVAVEQEIVRAIEQIETLKGQLRVLEDQARYGRVDVSFQYRDRAAPARDGTSPFAWLNTLNVQDVIAGHQYKRAPWRTRGVSLDTPPEGFSAWKRKGRYRAASPDNVLFRIRKQRHKPKSSLPFWKESMRERMQDAGYRVQDEQDLDVNGRKGALLELAAPLGNEDWTYLIALFPKRGRLVVVEAAGEIATFEARRQAIIDAIDRLTF